MTPIQQLSSGALSEIIRRQPSSPARTTFVWQLAVGPALARVTTATLDGTVLMVHCLDPRWTKEIVRAKAVVLARLQQMLGPEAVSALRVD
jgi:predicted nucleic acid-binding Zn ribbon protein